MTPVRVGTRGSALARAQTSLVTDAIVELGSKVETVEIVTHGDRSTAALTQIGGTGVFVSALRSALLADAVDIAVHSLKDLPTAPAGGLTVGAIPVREDPRDVLVARDGLTLAELPAGSLVGTGSPRRAAQLRALGLGLEVVDVRGNVDSRLKLVANGQVDAVVLARAGLSRLGLAGEATELLDPLLMLPCPGQGALAVECRSDDLGILSALELLDDPHTRAAVTAERALLARLEAGCSAPVGALAEVVEGEDGDELSLRAVVAAVDGSGDLRRSATAPLPGAPPDPGTATAAWTLETTQAAEALGRALAEHMLSDGAAELMPVPAAMSGLPAGEGDQ